MTDPLFPLSEATRVDVLARLSRIEGQIRGVKRMIDDGRDCHEVITQLSAVRAAMMSVSTTLAERCAHESLCNDERIDSDELTKLFALLRASR
jgi:DNA-binding FrmR family transcriptional regulator